MLERLERLERLQRLDNIDAIRAFVADFRYPIVVTRGPTIVAVNEAWVAILGFPREEVEGRNYLDFMPPEERARFRQRMALRAKAPEATPFTQMTSLALKADGRATVVHVQPTVVPTAEGDPYVVNFLFVVPDRDTEIELAELLVAASTSLAKARTVSEVRQLTIAQLGAGGYTAAFFRRDGTAIHPLDATLPPHVDRADLEVAIREERASFAGPDQATPSTVVIPIPRGAEVEVIAVAGPRLVSPLRAALRLFAQGVGSAIETAASIADLERQNRELSETRAELVRHERLAALGEMAASVAHEVRNPVGVISNAVSTLRRRLDGAPATTELFSIIDEECLRLEIMVRDLLEFARPRHVNFTLENLTEVADEAISAAALQPDPAVRDAKFEVETATDVPPARVDRDLLRQALVNLLVNAAQASDGDGRVVVRVGVDHDGDVAAPTIAVVDRGSGISATVIDRIFDPFFTTRAQGSGLGLAVVKRVVDALRARVTVESAPGRGATFKLTFRP